MTDSTQISNQPHSPNHEGDGVSIRGIAIAGAAVVVLVAAAMAFIAVLLPMLRGDQPANAIGASQEGRATRVDADQREKLARLRHHADATLASYAWVEKDKTARIPIDRAIAILTERGLAKVGWDKERSDAEPPPKK